jgi:type II secretory pathway pseudopilin PulG
MLHYISKYAAFCREEGLTLVEMVMVIVVLGIAIPSLMSLVGKSVESSIDSENLSKAVFFAQQKIEQIKADKANASRGYDYVTTNGQYGSDTPAAGFSRSVLVTTGSSHNGVAYALVAVTVSHEGMQPITLKTWLVDYSS